MQYIIQIYKNYKKKIGYIKQSFSSITKKLKFSIKNILFIYLCMNFYKVKERVTMVSRNTSYAELKYSIANVTLLRCIS